MDSANQHESIGMNDLKDLVNDLVNILQQEPKVLAMKRLFQCLSQEQNKSDLSSCLFEKVNSALNSASDSIDLSDLNKLLCDLVDILQREFTGLAMQRVLQCIFNLMEHKNVNLSPSLFEKLISVMIAEFNANCGTELSTDHRQLVSNILACVQLQVTKFPSAEGKSLLEQLWSPSPNGEHVHPVAAQILVKLLDDFVRDLGLERCPDLLVVIQQLLQSKEKKERQSAYFLMHKLKKIFDTNNDVAGAIKCTKQQWSDFIDVVEQLEEQQMHSNLIRVFKDYQSGNDDFSPRIHILYKRSFQSDNISIVYETVKFIVSHLKLSQLTDWNLMEEFLAATNRTQLYNVEDEDRSYPLFKKFVSENDKDSIIEALVNIPWEWNVVPLCEWLKSIPKEEVGDLACISKEMFFKLCSVVVKNRQLFESAVGKLLDPFQATIEQLPLEDYLTYIEMIYKEGMPWFEEHRRLTSKIDDCNNFEMKVTYFSPLRCEIISCRMAFSRDNYVFIAIINKLRNLQRSQHGCLRLFCLYGIFFEDEIRDFYSTEYGVDVSLVQNGKDLKAIQRHLLDKLKCETSEEKSYLLKVTAETFVDKINNWNEIEELQLNPVDLLQQGGWKTQGILANLLENCNQRLQDENVLPAFIASLKNYPFIYPARSITQYAAKHLKIEEQKTIFCDIISDHLKYKRNIIYEIFNSNLKVPIPQVLKIILDNLPLSDEAWIEKAYSSCLNVPMYEIYFALDHFVKSALLQSDFYVKKVGDELIRINKELSETHPNYRNNSKEHRFKFYIAKALLRLAEKYKCSNELWSALFSQNEQLNITCMYELIVARTLPNLHPLLERSKSISTLEPRQQMSFLSVTYIFLRLNWKFLDFENFQKVYHIIMSLASKDKSQVRQFAKLIEKSICAMCKERSLPVPLSNLWQTTFEGDVANISIEPQLQAHLFPNVIISFSFKTLSEIHAFCSYTFFMSNIQPSGISREESIILNKFREAFKSALSEHQHETNVFPKSDIYPKPDLVPKNEIADLIVVAALIDDSTTLNELIQTCKICGVRTLILSDSTNLSANSKDLNIAKVKPEELQDYLREKKRENYNIVATQNTGQNANFLNFSFEKKTILLFGPEQNDAPENLRDFLDNTVEIPQNRFQKAQQLFIFKYYQQYLAKD